MNFSKTAYKTLLFGALVIGLLAYVARFTYFQGDDHEVIQEILCTIGNIMVVGVAVGFFTTIVQNLGLFKEELGNVIYAKDFLVNRKDINQIWLNASKAVFEGKFPEIHQDLFERMLVYLKNKDVAYYNNYEMHILLEWHSKEKRLVKTTRTIFFDLIATSKNHQYYTFSTWGTVNEGDYYSVNIDVTVNDKAPKAKHINISSEQIGNVKRETVNVSLKNDLVYHMCIKEEKIYNIDSDFVVGYIAKYITNNVRIQLIHPEDILICPVSCGTQINFQEVNNSKNINEYRYNHVLLPKQGFCIALNPITTR